MEVPSSHLSSQDPETSMEMHALEKERVQKQKAALKGPTKKQIKLDEKAAEKAVQDHWDKVPLFKVASKSQLESCFLMITGLLAKAIISG